MSGPPFRGRYDPYVSTDRRAIRAAVIDTIGVDPGHARTGIGHAPMSQLMDNLATLHVDTVRTEIARDNLLNFPAKHGFAPCQRLVLSKWVE